MSSFAFCFEYGLYMCTNFDLINLFRPPCRSSKNISGFTFQAPRGRTHSDNLHVHWGAEIYPTISQPQGSKRLGKDNRRLSERESVPGSALMKDPSE